MENKKFNLIGFDFTTHRDLVKYKTCVFHHSILIKSKEDPTKLLCRECGLSYLERDTATDEQISTMFGPGSNQSRIIQARKKRKYYDNFGSLIPESDTDTIDLIKGGKKLVYYENKVAGDGTNSDVYIAK